MSVPRGVKVIVVFLLSAVVVSMAGMATMYFMVSRAPSVASNSVLVLRVPGGLSERQANPLLTSLMGDGPTVQSVVNSLRKAKVDTRIRGVVLKPSGPQLLWGKAQEIRDAVLDYKESGKPIVAFLEFGGTQEYYLASAADKVFLVPGSPLDLVGVASYEMFIRGALDKIGAHPDMLNAGDFKTAANFYTETTMTPAHREMAESLNRDLYEQIVDGIADGRRLAKSDVRRLIDEGPFLPADAVEAGLVDALVYADEVKRQEPFSEVNWREISDRDYRQISLASVGLNRGRRIALIYAVGTINSGTGGVDITGGEVLGSDTLVRAIRAARTDDSVRAIVLRIDSPGGSAVASDVIWREVMLAKADKPVIASMSDLGASGGYYIAMGADTIVAQPATLTGSIGVVAGKITTGGTYEKVGVTLEPVSNGRFAEIYSPVTPFSDDERAKMQEHIDAIYEQFLTKAAEGRGTTRDAVHDVAQGRVWTGRQAKEHGLIDELGGLGRAIALAKERVGIDADDEVELVAFPRPKSLFELLNEGFTVAQAATRLGWFPLPPARALGAATAPLRLFRSGEPLALMPGVFVP
ncbi:MAG TPA: signal peptide peptidase SppA [Vicinamibacterales bacterium]|nr:signal peptide peptidase SppA [Vicinamibacterales bacterium]HJN47100.1 signal peptide peptidase SppA [Vicinamibacterales bacterium]